MTLSPKRQIARMSHDHITPILNHLYWLPVRKRATFMTAAVLSTDTQISVHGQPDYLSVLQSDYDTPTRQLQSSDHPPPAVPASRQHSVHQPCLQINRSSFTIHCPSEQSTPQTTPQDSSVLLHHCHSLTNHTTSAYNSNLVRHMARYKCSLLPCLLTFLYFRLINMVDKFYCSSSKQRSMTTTAATSRRQMTKVM